MVFIKVIPTWKKKEEAREYAARKRNAVYKASSPKKVKNGYKVYVSR